MYTNPITSPSPSTPQANPIQNINIALLSSPHSISKRRLWETFFKSPTPSIDIYENITPCIERFGLGFSLNCSPELPPAIQKILYQYNTTCFRSFNAAIDLDATLETDGFDYIKQSRSLSPNRKTKEVEILQNPDLEVHFAIRIHSTGLYVHSIPLFRPQRTYKTFSASFVGSWLEFDCDPVESSANGTATFYNPCSKWSYSTPFWFFSPLLSTKFHLLTPTPSRKLRNNSPRTNQRSTAESLWL